MQTTVLLIQALKLITSRHEGAFQSLTLTSLQSGSVRLPSAVDCSYVRCEPVDFPLFLEAIIHFTHLLQQT
jgi:hypothetical protein